VVVVACVQTQHWLRHDRARARLHHYVLSLSTIVLATMAASAVLAASGGGAPFAPAGDLLVVVLALLAYPIVNNGLVASIIALTATRPGCARLFGHWDDNVLELATLALGVDGSGLDRRSVGAVRGGTCVGGGSRPRCAGRPATPRPRPLQVGQRRSRARGW
jgi:hypothetical protein